MFSPCSVNFMAAAVFPELISAKIEQIDNALKYVKFQRQADILLIKGWIDREITYRQPSGHVRNISGSFHFRTSIQSDITEEQLPLETALTQQSFILDPRTGSLEQTFVLKLREKETGVIYGGKKWVSLAARQVMECGHHSACGRIDLELPDNGCEPINLMGRIWFSDNQCAWLNGTLYGTIRCRNADGILAEYPLEKEIDFIDSIKPFHQAHQELSLMGVISSYTFFQPPNRSHWTLTIKVDCQWAIVESKNIRCLAVSSENNFGSLVIQSFAKIAKCNRQIYRDLFLPVNLKPAEIQCTIENLWEKESLNGFILSAVFSVEIYGVDSEGQEIYSVFRHELIEWIPSPVKLGELKHLHFVSRLIPVNGPYTLNSHGISFKIFFDYEGLIMQSQFHRIETTQEENGKDFLVKSFQHRREFFLMGEESVDLCGRDVAEINDISVQFLSCRGVHQNGWLKVDGLLEVSVSYTGIDQGYRCKIFNFPLKNVFDWDEIDENFEALCYGTVENNMLMHLDDIYRLSYLLRFECVLLKNESVKLTVFSDEESTNYNRDQPIAPIAVPKSNFKNGYDIRLEEFLPFSRSAPVEIVEKNLVLTDICCNKIGEQLLITGIQEWSLHFRNYSDIYETQKYKIPFWRYFPDTHIAVDNQKPIPLSHRILEYDVSLIKKRPFSPRTGHLSVRFELSFPEDDNG